MKNNSEGTPERKTSRPATVTMLLLDRKFHLQATRICRRLQQRRREENTENKEEKKKKESKEEEKKEESKREEKDSDSPKKVLR